RAKRREPDMASDRIIDLVESDGVDFSRRRFLSVSAAVGGGLLIGFATDPSVGATQAAKSVASPAFAPNAFIRIGGDGKVVLIMPYVEMGQGTYTSIPMLIAEELEVDLKQVQLEHAPPNEKLYANPLLGVQATGNSNAYAGHGSRCVRPARSREPCLWPRPPNAGMSILPPAALKAVRSSTCRPGDAPGMARSLRVRPA